MLNYNKRIVFTGGSGRFAKAFKKIEDQVDYNFYFPQKKEVNILNLKSIKDYLRRVKPKYLLHLAGLSRPMNIH